MDDGTAASRLDTDGDVAGISASSPPDPSLTLIHASDVDACEAAHGPDLPSNLENESPNGVPPSEEGRLPRLVGTTPEVEPAQVVEAILFASDAPLSLSRLTEMVGCGTQTEVRCWIADLNLKYQTAGLAFRIEEIARGYQMLTLPAFRPWLAKLDKQRNQSRLSAAALETLAIIAYKQPIIRADIEAIRGVACGDGLHRLREAGLIKIVGRAEVVGRPMLYGTTRKFLDQFGLADLDDLPPMEALTLRRGPAVVAPPTEPAPALKARAAAAGA